MWALLRNVLENILSNRSGVIPSEVRDVNRSEHMRMTDQNILGNLIARAVASDIKADEFWTFVTLHIKELRGISDAHKLTLEERFAKASGRYRFR